MHKNIFKNKNALCFLLLLMLSLNNSIAQIVNGDFENYSATCSYDYSAINAGLALPWKGFSGSAGVTHCYIFPIQGSKSGRLGMDNNGNFGGMYQDYNFSSGGIYHLQLKYKVKTYINKFEIVLTNGLSPTNSIPTSEQIIYSQTDLVEPNPDVNPTKETEAAKVQSLDVKDFVPNRQYSQLAFRVYADSHLEFLQLDDIQIILSPCCPNSQLVQNQIVTAGSDNYTEISALNYIRVGNNVAKPSTNVGNVEVKAGSTNSRVCIKAGNYVSFEPGFSVTASSNLTLYALPQACKGYGNIPLNVAVQRIDANTLRASVTGGSGNYSYKWIIGGQTTNTSYNHISTSSNSGTVTVTDLSCSNYFSTQTKDISPLTARLFEEEDSVSAADLIKIYPNPTQGDLLNIYSLDELDIEVYNRLGRLILQQHISQDNNTIAVDALPSDLYFVKLYKDGNLVKVEKVLHVK